MTRWLPAEKMQVMADGKQKQQVAVRSMFQKEIWQKVLAPRVREPIFHMEAHYLHYNPNLVRDKKTGKLQDPEPPKEHHKRHVEELVNMVPYLECLERRQNQAWDDFEAEYKEFYAATDLAGHDLGDLYVQWTHREDQEWLQKLSNLMRRGVPSNRRTRIWSELTLARRVASLDGVTGGPGQDRNMISDPNALARAAEQEYLTLLNRGLPQLSDAMAQLQEDAFLMSSWESVQFTLPEAYDFHMHRVKRAKNVVTALLAVQDGSVAYCQSLLVLAFYMLLPQGYKDEKMYEEKSTLLHPTESEVFWLLYTLICTRCNGVYREYYGVPSAVGGIDGSAPVPCLVAGGGAMQDVALLECCLSYHEPQVWQRLNAIGFQLSTVFYGCFMRLFATYMPTATVFRFWDMLFAQSTNNKASPNARAYLVNLAFGIIRAKKLELLVCESALEMRQCILGALGSLYDTCSVVDLVNAADLFLWSSGSGFSSGKVGYLWTQRDEIFKGVNYTFKQQNEILKQLTHLIPLRFKDPSRNKKGQDSLGCTTTDLVKEVIPLIQTNLESMKQSSGAQTHWAIHRPMPLASRVLAESSFDKAWSVFSTNFLHPPKKPPIPQLVGPVQGSHGLEPANIASSDLVAVLEKELPGWGQHATALWQVFTNRPRSFAAGVPMHSQQMGSLGFGGFGASNDPYAMYGSTGPTDASAGALNSNFGASYQNDLLTSGYQLDEQGNPRPTALQNFVSGLFGVAAPKDPNMEKTGLENVKESISVNELYAGLICASRGTLAQKAAALFNVYAYNDLRGKELQHINPVTRLAKSAAEDVSSAMGEISRALAPMSRDDPESKNNCLMFEVKSNYPRPHTCGWAFVHSLAPFVSWTDEDAATLGHGYLTGPQTAAELTVSAKTAVVAGSAKRTPHTIQGWF
eukprot:TRINITY_DN5191_c0_g1_i4.p1 TRINITY_DN5191_c0_g1~~TRINITY_DN5191_c0_g1_i4.p1  ORF type:complete len:1026 (-),score=234.54 TRINITY_DN5191_c0_g1_i4:181-2922(-)